MEKKQSRGTKLLNDYGVTIIRFDNEEVFRDIEQVLLKILQKLREL